MSPIRNDLIGVYRTLKLEGTTYVVENATRDRNQSVEAKSLMQGTPGTTILDIGMAGETFTVNAPVLIGGGSALDGKILLANQMEKFRNLGTLPILTAATVDIKEEGVNLSCTLESDGNPETTNSIYQLNEPGYPVGLDPMANTPTRIAKNYDVRVGFGPYKYFVQDGKISVNVSIDRKVFFASLDGNTQSGLLGTPYPWMGVSEVKVSGSGTAATIIGDINDPFTFNAFNGTTGNPDITIQATGGVVVDTSQFAVEVSDGAGGWDSIFSNDSGDVLVDFSKAIIKRSNFNGNTKILSVSFDFVAYVKLPNTTF